MAKRVNSMILNNIIKSMEELGRDCISLDTLKDLRDGTNHGKR